MTTKMREISDGGPAFPQDGGCDQLESPYLVQGMSLRDYFAAKALPFALGEQASGHQFEERCAGWAYRMADAMLKARQP